MGKLCRKRNWHRDHLQTLQEEQAAYRDDLRDEEGDGSGSQWAPFTGAGAPTVPLHPQRPYVTFKNLWDTTGEVVDWRLKFSNTQPADFSCQSSVFEAAKREAARLMEAVLAASPITTGNTVVKFTVHGAAVTVFGGLEETLNSLCQEFFPDYIGLTDDPFTRFEEVGPAKFYGRLLKGPAGIFVKAENKLGPSHLSIEFAGEAFEVYGMVPFARFLTRIHESGQRWHLTRIDNAWDGVDFTPETVFKALKNGHVRSLAQRDTINLRDTPFGDEAGKTVYFGKRGSADHLRVYDRRETGTRIEHECRKARAKLLGLMFIHTPLERWHEVAMGSLRDFVDFVKRDDGENVTRCKLLKFWAKFIGKVERMNVSMGDLASTVKAQVKLTTAKVQAGVKAISRRVLTLVDSVGADVFMSMIEKQRVRMRPSDVARVAETKMVIERAVEIFGKKPEEIFGGSSVNWWHAMATAAR